MANNIHSEYKNVELRKLNADVLCDIIYILEIDNDWKKVMSLIPKDIQSAKFEAKYNSEHIRLIEEHAKATNQKCTEILFDEWGTSGRVRPTLNTLKEIVLRAQMFRAADEIAKLLKELPPLRPNDGPAAPITINITEMFDNDSTAINSIDSNINKLCNGTTKEMKSASDMIKFSNSLPQESLDKINFIQFSKENTSSTMNIPDLSALIGKDKSFSSHNLPDSQGVASNASEISKSLTYLPNINNQHNPDVYQTSFPNIDISSQRIDSNISSQNIDSVILNDIRLKQFAYDDLKSITNNFSENLSTKPYLTGRIGSGGFGDVFVGNHPQYGLLAVKKTQNNLSKSAKPDIATKVFNAEVKFLSHFRHKNIVLILGYSIDGPAPCIVCEYIGGGSLHYNIAAKTLNEKHRMSIILGTAEGLKHVHTYYEAVESNSSQSALTDFQRSTKNFVHGDVKSANILLTQDYVPKLCDFGLSKQYEATTLTTSPLGTSAYMAHEMLHGTVTQKGDIYSFGIVLLELLTGLNPIIYTNDSHKYNIKDYVEENVTNNDISKFLDPVVGEWSKAEEIYNLAQQCLKYDRKSRPSIVEVCDTLYAIQSE